MSAPRSLRRIFRSVRSISVSYPFPPTVSPEQNVQLSTTLTARGAAFSDVSVNFYDGDPQNGGRLFAAEPIPYIAADSQRVVQGTYRTNTCGVHQLLAVVNGGKPTEKVRRAQPVRVDCNASR